MSTECTEPVSSPAGFLLTAQQATAVSGRHRSVSALLSHESDLLSGPAHVASLSAPHTLSEKGRSVLSCLEWKLGPLGPQPDYGQSEVDLDTC